MRRGTPRAIADLVPLAVPALAERLQEQRIRHAWAALVGPDAARRSRPQGLSHGCLQIVVDNSPWLHELTLRLPELTRRLTTEFDEVRSLRFVVGAVASDQRTPAPRNVGLPPLTADDRREIELATAGLTDPDLAATARRVLGRAWRSAKAPRTAS
jgi:hypothetical protein